MLKINANATSHQNEITMSIDSGTAYFLEIILINTRACCDMLFKIHIN